MLTTAPLSELPRQCRQWSLFVGGRAPLDEARHCPDEWVPVIELTLLEALRMSFGRSVAARHEAHAVQFDSASGKYIAYPLRMMPRAARILPWRINPWRDIWKPMIV
jgi:hypothetical protein